MLSLRLAWFALFLITWFSASSLVSALNPNYNVTVSSPNPNGPMVTWKNGTYQQFSWWPTNNVYSINPQPTVSLSFFSYPDALSATPIFSCLNVPVGYGYCGFQVVVGFIPAEYVFRGRDSATDALLWSININISP